MERPKACNLSKVKMERSLQDLVLKPKSKKIARPPNAFMIFAREHRKIFAQQNPNMNNKIISKMLGNAWKKTDLSTKLSYFEKAKEMNRLHKQKYPGYVYSPRVARLQKLKRTMRKARMKHHQDDTDEEQEVDIPQDFKCKGLKTRVKTEVKEAPEKWEETFLKKSSDSGYVPNNPNFFKNSEMVSNEDEVPSSTSHQPPPSSPSSSSSLGCESHYPDFYFTPPSRCGPNCDKHCQERAVPHPMESYWNPYQRDCFNPITPEPDSFSASLQSDCSFDEKPQMSSTPCCSHSLTRNPYLMPYPRSLGQSFYESFPWQHPYHFRVPFNEDRHFHQNLNYPHSRHFDFNYYGTSMPNQHSYSEQINCPSNENRNDETKPLSPNTKHIGDKVKTNHHLELKPSRMHHMMSSNNNQEISYNIRPNQLPMMPSNTTSFCETEVFQREKVKTEFNDNNTPNTNHISDAVGKSLQPELNCDTYQGMSPNIHQNAPFIIAPSNVNQGMSSNIHPNESPTMPTKRNYLCKTEIVQHEGKKGEFNDEDTPNTNHIGDAVRKNLQSELNCNMYQGMNLNIHQNAPSSPYPMAPTTINPGMFSNIHPNQTPTKSPRTYPFVETKVFQHREESDEFFDDQMTKHSNYIDDAVRRNLQPELNCKMDQRMSPNSHKNASSSAYPTGPSNIDQEMSPKVHKNQSLIIPSRTSSFGESQVFQRNEEKDEFIDVEAGSSFSDRDINATDGRENYKADKIISRHDVD